TSEVRFATTVATEEIPADCSRLPAFKSEGSKRAAALRKHRDAERFQKFQFPYDPISAAPSAGSARTRANAERSYAHWVASFHNLRIGQPGVGHVAVNAGAAIGVCGRSGS